jgi:hypothetical protein
MTDESRQPAPTPEAPRLNDPVTSGSRGASDATLIIFLGGVMLLLLICVGFILAAS